MRTMHHRRRQRLVVIIPSCAISLSPHSSHRWRQMSRWPPTSSASITRRRENRWSSPRCSGSGGARLFASTVRGHTQDRRPLSARRTPPREQSTSHPTLGSPCWASTASQFRPSRAIVVTRRSCSMCEPVLEAGRRSPDRASVLPFLPAVPWSLVGLSRSCALVPRSIGGVSLAYQGITHGGWDAREEATAAGCVAAWFNLRPGPESLT